MTKQLRPYQSDGANDACTILEEFGLVYLMWGVRTGKTATALEVCRLFGAKNVLFLTKKKAISSVQNDYDEFGYHNHFSINIINDESMHKVVGDYDLIVHDESHRFGQLGKPGGAVKLFKEMFYEKPQIYLSGTPSPESFSQLYHQFWVSRYSPWREYRNFYAWAKEYVNVRQKKINSFMVNDYSDGIEDKIMSDIKHLCLTRTQEQSGFQSVITEEVLHVKMNDVTYKLCKELLDKRVIEGKEEIILADTAAKLMQKIHQLYSGTIKFESGNTKVLDTSKAEFIKERFAGKKIGIFYIFKAELDLLMSIFGKELLTTDIDEFNSTDKNIALQVVSGREGISLSKADYLVFYNIHHSATSYWQARDRLTKIDRPSNEVFWIFSEGGIEDNIYKVVKQKKKFTVNIFNKIYEKRQD